MMNGGGGGGGGGLERSSHTILFLGLVLKSVVQKAKVTVQAVGIDSSQ